MYVLGINAFHAGAAACLLRDGELVAAAEEERFNRIKYAAGFPSQAIRYCLSEAGITAYDLDHVAISRDAGANVHKKILFALTRRPSLGAIRDRLTNAAQVRDPKAALVRALQLDAGEVKAQFHGVQHHLAHMASAFFVSPFEAAAVVSIDGMGDFVSTMWGAGCGNRLDVVGSIGFPHSLGIFYTAVSQWLGFEKYGDEGKVMGLAPYGRPIYLDQMRRIVRTQRDGTFELDLDYFVHHTGGASMTWDSGSPTLERLYSPRLEALLGAARQCSGALEQHHLDVAASMQAMLELVELELLRSLQRATGETAVCLAGGVALNSVVNGKIRANTPFEQIFVQPAAGDAGTSLGAAYYVYHQVLGYPRRQQLRHAGTGPSFEDASIAVALEQRGLVAERLSEDELCRQTAALIARGDVVGWFQGRMEWGPRALGNRSIVADPRRAEMKDVLNARIKHRESFRPFAPSVLREASDTYFDQRQADPFMTSVWDVLPPRRTTIPAVTHVDGTARTQTVDAADTPLYWRLISEFESLTDVPVVVNTSFNDNEPIVCRPQEAIDCFLRTRMDALAIGNHLVRKAA
jgi:carbamoyltransferase